MILSRRVSLGGVQLDELHEAIVIRSVDPGVPHEEAGAVSRMDGWGMRMTGQHWESLDAEVTFAINVDKRAIQLRRDIFDAVVAWANRPKNYLRYNGMGDRRLYIDKVVVPGSGELRNRNAEYTIVFRAYSIPFWETETPTQVSRSNITSGTVQIDVGGTAPGVLDLEFRNISGKTIDDFAVTAGNRTMTLSGVGITASETLVLSHGTDGILRITSGSRNVYGKMTGADDLYVNPGTVNVSVAATRAGALTVSNRARWL